MPHLPLPPSLLILAAVLTAGCVTTDEGSGPQPVSETSSSSARSDVSVADTLRKMDRDVDRYVALGSQPGDDAARERALLGSALEAQARQILPDLVRLAGDRSVPGQRRIAAKALAFSPDEAAVKVLADALDESDPRLLTNATFALGRIKMATTPTERLVGLISHADGDVRNNALLALWHVVDARRRRGRSALDPGGQAAALPLLEAALFDPDDPLIRGHAAAALGAIGDPRSVDPLVNLLRDEHPFVRTHTALALGKIGDVKAIPALVSIIDETDLGTPRSAVITGLSLLLEKSGRTIPDNLGDSERAWTEFVRARLGPSQEPDR